MDTARFEFRKVDIERIAIALGMTFVECAGFVMLVCGILGIKIF